MFKKIVIIGGGFAGATLAKLLEGKFNVTLIDSKDYFEFTPSVLRSIVEVEHLKKIQVLHKHYLSKTKILRGYVKEVNDDYVVIDGKKIFFDYLIICSGSRYNSPFKEQGVVVASRADTLRDCYEELCRSKKILIIGGGLVGVELAGEILDKYKDKKVTLVHSKDNLIERNHHKAIKYAEKYLRSKGVDIIFNERVIEKRGKKFLTDKGREIVADLAFSCTGIVPNSEFMKRNFSKVLDENGYIKVDKFLQIESKKNIFAAGDVNNIKVEKTAQNAEKQANLVYRNIIALESGRELEEYISKPTPLVISLGKWRGIFASQSMVTTGFTPGLMKQFIEWKEMRKFR